MIINGRTNIKNRKWLTTTDNIPHESLSIGEFKTPRGGNFSTFSNATSGL